MLVHFLMAVDQNWFKGYPFWCHTTLNISPFLVSPELRTSPRNNRRQQDSSRRNRHHRSGPRRQTWRDMGRVPNFDRGLRRVRRRRTSPQKRCMARNRANENICPGKVRISRRLVDSPPAPPSRTRRPRMSRTQVGTQVRARRRARPPQNGDPATVTPSMDAPRPPRLPG